MFSSILNVFLFILKRIFIDKNKKLNIITTYETPSCQKLYLIPRNFFYHNLIIKVVLLKKLVIKSCINKNGLYCDFFFCFIYGTKKAPS